MEKANIGFFVQFRTFTVARKTGSAHFFVSLSVCICRQVSNRTEVILLYCLLVVLLVQVHAPAPCDVLAHLTLLVHTHLTIRDSVGFVEKRERKRGYGEKRH